jgi:hypothetical protein
MNSELALSPLGESDFWTPMGSIGPQKSGRVARRPDALHREAGRVRGSRAWSPGLPITTDGCGFREMTAVGGTSGTRSRADARKTI